MVESLPAHSAVDVSKRSRRPLVTGRPLWLAVMALTSAALLLRLPELRALAERTVDVRAEPGVSDDPTFRAVAVNTGLWMAVVLSLVVAAIYLSLASAIERHMLPVSLGRGRTRFGLLFSVAALSTVPVEVYCAITGTLTVRGSPFYILYLVAVGFLCPVPFSHSLKGLSHIRQAAVWGLSMSVAVLSYVV